MADLRVYYLDFKGIDAVNNSEGFSIGMSKELMEKKMDGILAEADRLSDYFTELNPGFFYDIL